MLHIETGKKNEILRAVSEPIKKNEIKEYLKLGKEMLKYIKDPDNGGVGLAAPQVGYNKRLIVVSLLKDREDENFPTIMMINPEILEHSSDMEKDIEGCLSVPGEKGKVERYRGVKIKYTDKKTKEKTLILNGLSARIVQHEVDHLNGILFTDKLKNKL
ncbi:MAG: peptide deformylase [Candidatus Gracilibacteria bacterium]|nr:peptide deformylase [Candidatus Gracilibacteria bacterium]